MVSRMPSPEPFPLRLSTGLRAVFPLGEHPVSRLPDPCFFPQRATYLSPGGVIAAWGSFLSITLAGCFKCNAARPLYGLGGAKD